MKHSRSRRGGVPSPSRTPSIARGSSVLNPRGAVYYLSADHQVTGLANNMAYPNGIALSPDDRTLYTDEFMAQRVIGRVKMNVEGAKLN